MANLTRLKVDELKALALGKGFKSEELEGLTKTQLIEIVEQSEDETVVEDNKTTEVVDDLKEFTGSEIHIHESLPSGEQKFIRTYSEEVHGADFIEKAKSFKGKKSGYIFVK